MPSLTRTNASDGAPTSTPVDNGAATVRQDSARPRTILYLNASKRKEAEAAARDLRRVQAHLERYRQVLDGHAATESDITQPLLKAARAAIKSYNCIPHPGDRARRTYMSAKRDFDETTRLMANDLRRLLQRIQAQNIAQPVHDGQ